MAKFLVTIHRPFGFDHEKGVTPAVMADIDRVNDEMVAAGVRVFVGGLKPIGTARALRRGADGVISESEGLYLKAAEYADGLWVLECSSMEEAVEWGKKAAAACRGGVEVREFHG